MNKTAYILIGIPTSGKSTWVNEMLPILENFEVISTDNIIEDIAKSEGKTYSEVFADNIKDATSTMMDNLNEAKRQNKSIIWDQTNCSVKSRKNKIRLLDGYEKIAVVFEIPSQIELERRLQSRPGKHIPFSVMNSMIDSFTIPTSDEGFDFIMHV